MLEGISPEHFLFGRMMPSDRRVPGDSWPATRRGMFDMAMQARDIEAMIKEALPDASVEIRDLAGDGDHYSAIVVSEAFRGLSRVKQHQLVYDALKGKMGGELHALALQTSAP
jgi:stress-induced morphogen